WANKRHIPFQIHTGLQEGSENIITNADPTLLANIFMQYRDVDFDVFHMGYPYQDHVSALAKVFPNVYIDMCWAHIISPTASINALVEWVDSVPLSKISAFGGDYCFIDGVAGHQFMARENVSRALAIKVKEGVFGVDEAKHFGKMLFYDNPKKLFHLENIR
ncbi:MAG: amidohydrolase family protein, partial [Firmicutes bacterium]|nr:amidohydrolase family protein [Bacillota bacterium]